MFSREAVFDAIASSKAWVRAASWRELPGLSKKSKDVSLIEAKGRSIFGGSFSEFPDFLSLTCFRMSMQCFPLVSEYLPRCFMPT